MKTILPLTFCFLLAVSMMANADFLSTNNLQTTDPPPKAIISSTEANTTSSNPNEAAESFTLTYDKRPEVTFSEATFDVQERVFALSISFNEPVSGFSAADITISNGSISDLQTTDSLSFNATVTPAGDGDIQLSVAENTAFDLVGNGNLASEGLSLAYDATFPTAAFSSEYDTRTNLSPLTVDLQFSEAVSSLSAEDLQLTNATLMSLQRAEPELVDMIGTNLANRTDYIKTPSGLAYDSKGNLYVGANNPNQIKIYDEAMNQIATLGDGLLGEGDYQFRGPTDIFIDHHDNIYVADVANHRVQIYDQQRQYVATIGSGEAGTSADHFNFPSNVAVDQQGRIYIVDKLNHRVQIFDAQRNHIHTLGETGTRGSGNNQFSNPGSVAISDEGFIYVLDRYNNRIQIFDPQFQYYATLGGASVSNEDYPVRPKTLALDSNGNIYVVDSFDDRILVYDSELSFIKAISAPILGLSIYGLYVKANGGILYSDIARIFFLDQDHNLSSTFGLDGSGTENDKFNKPKRTAVDAQHRLYVADEENHRVQVFDQDLNHVHTISGNEEFNSYEKFVYPTDVAVDKQGRIFVADLHDPTVHVYDSAFVHIETIYAPLDWGNIGIEVDQEGKLYIADTYRDVVLVYDQNFELYKTLGTGSAGSGMDQFDYPHDIAVDKWGTVYVTDQSNQRIQVFDANLNYKQTIDYTEYGFPYTLDTDALGNIYVLGSSNAIHVFDAKGNYSHKFSGGSILVGGDSYFDASGITIGRDGTIYITDDELHNVKVFKSQAKYQLKVVPIADGEVVIDLPENVTTDLFGNGNEGARFSILYDGSGPLASFSAADSISNQPDVEVAVNFDEPVSGLQAGSFVLTNATLQNLQTSDSTNFTAQLRATEEGYFSISLDSASVRDEVGNLNTQSAGLLLQYRILRDTLAPTVEIRSTARDTVEGEFVVEMILSEKVSGFVSDDISLSNASLLSLSTNDSTVFTATVTPLAKGMLSLSLGENVVTDSAGNGNLVSDTFSIYYDEKYTLSLQVTTEAETAIGEFTATLYQRVNGRYVSFIRQEITEGNAVQFDKLPEGEYTLGIQPADASLLTTYLGGKLLLAEAQAFYLDRNLSQSITFISAAVEQNEGIASISGILLKNDETTAGGRIFSGNQQLNGTPLVNVKVYLLNADTEQIIASDVTDEAGRFSFSKLPQGEYLLIADHEGLPNDKQANRITIAPDTEVLSLTAIVGTDVRIAQVQEEKQITSVAEDVLSQVRYYPNPIIDQLTLELSLDWLNGTLIVHDKLGRIQINTTLTSQNNEVDFTHLPAGVYIVSLLKGNLLHTFKISK